MSKRLKVSLGVLVLAGAGAAVFLATRDADATNGGITTVTIEKGTIVDKALAVGQIVPDQEIQVKSQISGRVKEALVEVGDAVEVGQALFSISPEPTPLELADQERAVQMVHSQYEQAESDLDRHRSLFTTGILSKDSFDTKQREFDQARIRLAQERDKLALLKEGRIARRSGGVDSVIRASAAGTVLERKVNPGDPVVPLTTFQDGTVLMTIADMSTLEFRGTVDEIDVGKLREGLPVRIQIGALPGAAVTGEVTKISPKAHEEEGATLFDVEAAIKSSGEVRLRAGFSANADVIIQEKKDVLLVPERLLIRESDKVFVEVPGAQPKDPPTKKEIQVGLSDGLNAEVVGGLAAGDKVIQRPPKEIK